MRCIARVSEIAPGGTRFEYKAGPFTDSGVLVRLSDGRVRAYKNECRHLAIPLDEACGEIWDAAHGELVCTAHGARYRPDDGLCVAGPCAGSHLKSLSIEIRGDEVLLDESALGGFFDG